MNRLNRQVLAFDVDGVIVNFFTPFLAHTNQLLGTQLLYEDCECHNLADAFGVEVEYMRSLAKNYETPEIMINLPAVKGAIQSLRILSSRYDLAIVTSRRVELQQVTDIWFKRNSPPVTIHYAIGRNNPFAGGSDRLYKPQVAEQIGALALIEDNEQEFLHWDSSIVEPICFDQPWNRCISHSHPHIPRLDWQGIVDRYMT